MPGPLKFENREWVDRERRVGFKARKNDVEVTFWISFDALEKHFGLRTGSPEDAKAAFRRNRGEIERVAELEHARGNTILTTETFDRSSGGMPIDE
jgi:uncharacterized protein DUF1488